MRIDIVTLFPEVALAPLSDSIIQRARSAGLVEVVGHQLRVKLSMMKKKLKKLLKHTTQ